MHTITKMCVINRLIFGLLRSKTNKTGMKKNLLLMTLLLCSLGAWSLEMPEIFSDHVMLQQNTEARLWGWAEKDALVKVITGWNGVEYSSKSDKKTGRWELKVKTPKASYDTYSITVEADGQAVTISDVLIGEVWFCSGQSNMEMPLQGFWNCPVEGANETIAMSGKYKHAIRCATIAKEGAQMPKDKVSGKWAVCEPKNAALFSACGYYFAQTLTELLDVPVGIINCSWGGSCVEGWLPKDTLLTYPDGLIPIDDTDYHAKMIMFNGMLYPLAGYTIKGFLWNQGESNVGREKEYIDRFATMTRLWRTMWRQPDDNLPIYAVELPPYRYGTIDGEEGPSFRAAQHEIAKVLEHYGCVCTSDLIYDYEPDQIHGCKKKEIGQRLAYMAATRDYGMEGIAAEAPEFEYFTETVASADDNAVVAGSKVSSPAMKMQVDKVYQLYFTNSVDGFDRMADIADFEAQDAEGRWHPAVVWASSAWQNVERQGCFLKLACPEAKEVKAIRYCYKNFIRGKLHNMRGLPVVPFCSARGL